MVGRYERRISSIESIRVPSRSKRNVPNDTGSPAAAAPEPGAIGRQRAGVTPRRGAADLLTVVAQQLVRLDQPVVVPRQLGSQRFLHRVIRGRPARPDRKSTRLN